MKRKTRKLTLLSLVAAMTLTCGAAVATAGYSPNFTWPEIVTAEENQGPVAKVGNTEYATIDEAITAWTNGTTLTLLSDVTLSDVVEFSSQEHHYLDLSTHTMTAAEGKNAFEIKSYGRNNRSESGALTITADANNPGTLNAGSKSCVYYKYNSTLANNQYDRPIIYIKGGVFYGASYGGFSSSGHTSAQDKCATFNISGGTFNCGLNLTKTKLLISGGTFNGSISCTGGGTSHRLISGGTFKSFGWLTADAASKFAVGSAISNYNVGLYVDDNGYLVVGGLVITETGNEFEASSTYDSWSSYLQYSSANANGLYYTSAEVAVNKGKAVTLYTNELDFRETALTTSAKNAKITLATQEPLTVKYNQADKDKLPKAENIIPPQTNSEFIYIDKVEDGVVTRTYSVVPTKLDSTNNSLTVEVNEGNESILPEITTQTEDCKVIYEDTVTNGILERKYMLVSNATVAKVDDTYYKEDEISSIVGAIKKESTVTLYEDIDLTQVQMQTFALTQATLENGTLTLPENVTINGNGKKITGSIHSEGPLKVNGGLNVEGTLYTNNTLTLGGSLNATSFFKGANSKVTGTVTATNTYNLKEVKFTLATDKTELKTNESLKLTVSISEDCYSAEYTLTYDAGNFLCPADIDGDGEISVPPLFNVKAGELATYNFVAKNEIQKVTEKEYFQVTGNVVEYKEQVLNNIPSSVVGSSATVKVSLNYTAEVKADYVNGYSLVLVKGDSEEYGYAYDGAKMFYVEAYEAYAILVAGEVDAATIDEKLSKSKDCETISQSYNVNAEYVTDGLVDLKDATAVYACSIKDFANVAAYMELYLRADVNGDYKVNVIDVNEVVKNYTK